MSKQGSKGSRRASGSCTSLSPSPSLTHYLPKPRPGLSHTPWYAFKDAARTYLAELNKDKKVLEYCLFQLGYFTNYLARPTETATHVKTIDMPFDFENKRMLIAEGSEDAYTTWTTVRDLQEVVCRAVEYEGVWPVVGGIRGSRITMGELVKLGEKVRGMYQCLHMTSLTTYLPSSRRCFQRRAHCGD